jgi:hypothetical protein
MEEEKPLGIIGSGGQIYPVYLAPTGPTGPAYYFIPAEEVERPDAEKTSLEGVFDYSNSRISDFKGPYAKYYGEYLSEIENKIAKISNLSIPVVISFKENYLRDAGINGIFDFCNKNEYLKENLVILDLSNNRGTSAVLQKGIELAENCKNLKCIDLSINYIDLDQAENALAGLANLKSIIKYSPF